MKNLLVYHIVILTPLAIIIVLLKTEMIDTKITVGLFMFYALIYRTFTDGKRLYDKKVIAKKDLWKMLIPGIRIKYFKELYLT